MGEWMDKSKGKLEEIKGSVTGDRSEQSKGIARQEKGEIKGDFERLKTEVKDTFGSNRDPNFKR